MLIFEFGEANLITIPNVVIHISLGYMATVMTQLLAAGPYEFVHKFLTMYFGYQSLQFQTLNLALKLPIFVSNNP
jgi:hypothetical protein